MKPLRYALGVALSGFAVLALASAGQAQTTFDTTYAWNGRNGIVPFGVPTTATYGQTFVAPGGNLNDFTFYVSPDGNTLSIQADVYAWSGSLFGGNGPQGAVGPALYTSPVSTVINGFEFQAVTTPTGGVPLTAGTDYVALLTVSDTADFHASTGAGTWGQILFTHVAGDGGGGFNFYNNSIGSPVNNGDWDDFVDFGDSAWTAHFGPSAVPEPGAYALLGSLTLTGAAFLRRKRVR